MSYMYLYENDTAEAHKAPALADDINQLCDGKAYYRCSAPSEDGYWLCVKAGNTFEYHTRQAVCEENA